MLTSLVHLGYVWGFGFEPGPGRSTSSNRDGHVRPRSGQIRSSPINFGLGSVWPYPYRTLRKIFLLHFPIVLVGKEPMAHNCSYSVASTFTEWPSHMGPLLLTSAWTWHPFASHHPSPTPSISPRFWSALFGGCAACLMTDFHYFTSPCSLFYIVNGGSVVF